METEPTHPEPEYAEPQRQVQRWLGRCMLLIQQYERMVPEPSTTWFANTAFKAVDRGYQHLAVLAQSKEFSNLVIDGIAPDGTVDWTSAGLTRVLRESHERLAVDGWTCLDSIKDWLAQAHKDQVPERYGCRSWPHTLHASRQFDLVYRVQGDQKVGWFRPRGSDSRRLTSKHGFSPVSSLRHGGVLLPRFALNGRASLAAPGIRRGRRSRADGHRDSAVGQCGRDLPQPRDGPVVHGVPGVQRVTAGQRAAGGTLRAEPAAVRALCAGECGAGVFWVRVGRKGLGGIFRRMGSAAKCHNRAAEVRN